MSVEHERILVERGIVVGNCVNNIIGISQITNLISAEVAGKPQFPSIHHTFHTPTSENHISSFDLLAVVSVDRNS